MIINYNRKAIVQLISISRALAALLFTSIVLLPSMTYWAAALFGYACISDFFDGYLARRWRVESSEGRTIDLLGDKYLTIVSALYATTLGVNIFAGAMIIFREVVLLSLRGLRTSEGNEILQPMRIIGALYSIPIWIITGITLLRKDFGLTSILYLHSFYWIWGCIGLLNLLFRIYGDRKKISNIFKED